MIKEYKEPTNKIEKGLLYLQHYGLKQTVAKSIRKAMGHDQEHYSYRKFLKAHPLTKEELDKQRHTVFTYNPVISIVIPLYNTPERFLTELIQSFTAQTYPNWQLCLGDGSPKDGLYNIILKATGDIWDERIVYKKLEGNTGIAGNTNAAMELATGDFIGFTDHDDLITPDAMFYIAKALNEDNTIQAIYSDEDKIDMDSKEYFLPHFKSDFNIDLLCSHNYITHLFVARADLVKASGGIKSEFDGAQDHDFDLRILEQCDNIYHIPRVLYHWRTHPASTADHPEAKMYAYENGRRAVEEHYKRIGVPARVELDTHLGYYRTIYEWPDTPLLSIVIPNMNHRQDLQECIDSIVNTNSYTNVEFIIVENNSDDTKLFEYYKELELRSDINAKVLNYTETHPETKGSFNFSKLVNYGVANAKGDYILLLNNDTRMINADAISEMMGFVRREDVGVVGARLYYGNNTVQHAGLILGLGGVANSQFLGSGREQVGYFYRSTCVQDLSAVTGACLLTKRSLWDEVGGFDEELAVAFNDVDYCLKLRALNKLCVYTPFAQWYHLESLSRGLDHQDAEKKARMDRETEDFMAKWKEVYEAGDPYYNPNLSLTKFDYSFGRD
ncbi:glycosyltransferase family 2 protein [Pseudobutyrivibrio xylanivorans]|uniref:Glycosyl transferase family 2 n=1 Tax=Pseudobutyrivibrio xylanivorans TaxID=185007 RepID=A0A5P6VTV2_PSEXY|nr:glycosyltransferase [Pseudobutyrivibrio xylanivorans]QFJ56066.1 glycosyl transferase family 2 [Pseudobutyrivibrio xylanivorans]